MRGFRTPSVRGVFKIPRQLPNNVNIFSQEVDDTENSYLNNVKCTPNLLLDKDGGAVYIQRNIYENTFNAELLGINQQIIPLLVPLSSKKINPVCLKLSQILERLSAPNGKLEFKLLFKGTATLDSFCVNTEEDAELSLRNAVMGQLEIAEMLLKQRRKRRKKIPKKEINTKRRRVICISTDSD